jgi:protein phosphatase 2C family protein 2/3
MTKPSGKKLPNGEWPKCSYFAIYDGHGGSSCADYLKECLHTIIINQECFPFNPA